MNLLEKSLLPLIDEENGLIEQLLGDGHLIFQQDNAPIHTSAKTTHFMKQNGLRTLPWPANSPDLNPIEELWHTLKRRIWAKWRQRRSSIHKTVTSEDLENLTQEAWKSLEPNPLRALVESMPKRVENLICVQGGHLKY